MYVYNPAAFLGYAGSSWEVSAYASMLGASHYAAAGLAALLELGGLLQAPNTIRLGPSSPDYMGWDSARAEKITAKNEAYLAAHPEIAAAQEAAAAAAAAAPQQYPASWMWHKTGTPGYGGWTKGWWVPASWTTNPALAVPGPQSITNKNWVSQPAPKG